MNHQAGHPPSLVPRGEGGVLANGASDAATTPAAAGARPRGGITGRRVLAGGLIPAATAALVVTGLRVPTPAGVSASYAVAYGLVAVWALTAVVTAMARQRTPQWQVAVGSLAAAVALTAARLADEAGGGHRELARATATVTSTLVIAIFLHFLLAVPDGRLGGRSRRIGAGLGYAAAVATGLGLALASRPFTVGLAALSWSLAALCALPALRRRYAGSAGRDRERMQWVGVGAVLAADAALTVTVLHVLVGWPVALAAVAAGCTAAVPLGLIVGEMPRLAPYSGRLLVHMLSVAGFTVVVAVIYLVIVLGLGKGPSDPADRELLGLSMLAAAVAAIGFIPARNRLVGSATRFVYGVRQAPDEVLRTFGSRLTRAIAMDELLLQLAESLRKTMRLTSAEVYTGAGDVLERAVSVPDAGPRAIVVTARERPVVTRAGVSGNAWASVWLPAFLDGREHAQLRLAPISHGGELLGLIVVERPAAADAFSEDDDRVLTELARQTGLAFHNMRLDAELQTTLDELRKQADALRESRARIVASGDAERRRVERNLHDGAQQNLVAIAVNLRLARDIIADDPAAAADLLDQLAADVQQTIREVRELAHGIYPPLLADSGLGEALKAAAGRSPLPVEVIAEGLGRYSAEVEAAIYFCCLEALQNAGKHAPGANVTVRVWEESGGLLFGVSDDGPGFGADTARGGHGFVNMADRLGAIGGSVRWDSEPAKGTRVRGSVPLA